MIPKSCHSRSAGNCTDRAPAEHVFDNDQSAFGRQHDAICCEGAMRLPACRCKSASAGISQRINQATKAGCIPSRR